MLLVSASSAEVVETFLVENLIDISMLSVESFAVSVIPLLTLFTLDPLLSVCDCTFTLIVDLLAVIAELISIVSIGTWFAKPEEFAFSELSARPEVSLSAKRPVSADHVCTCSQSLLCH